MLAGCRGQAAFHLVVPEGTALVERGPHARDHLHHQLRLAGRGAPFAAVAHHVRVGVRGTEPWRLNRGGNRRVAGALEDTQGCTAAAQRLKCSPGTQIAAVCKAGGRNGGLGGQGYRRCQEGAFDKAGVPPARALVDDPVHSSVRQPDLQALFC